MRNLTMMTDLYELTMMNGYLRFGMENNRACFDIFYRKQGDMTAYAVAAGLEQAIDYVRNLHFSNDDIAYLRSLKIFDEAFLDPPVYSAIYRRNSGCSGRYGHFSRRTDCPRHCADYGSTAS